MRLYEIAAETLTDGPLWHDEVAARLGWTSRKASDSLRWAKQNGLARVLKMEFSGSGAKRLLWEKVERVQPPEEPEEPSDLPRGEYAWIGPVASVWQLGGQA